MKKLIACFLLMTSILICCSGCGAKTYTAEITVENYGVITVSLDAKVAPVTVKNFVELAKSGFYDGLTFHRIMEGFMIQGGDPKGNGTGGSDEKIKGEFSKNGVKNEISHKRGVISMARGGSAYEGYFGAANLPPQIEADIRAGFNSASSQFFIVHEDSPFLDGSYAAFGHVTSGMDVVDAIAENVIPIDDNGTVPAENQPVITSIRIIE